MAEFCLDCFNELNGTNYSKREVRLADDFCEECCQRKPCVVDLKPDSFWFLRIIFGKE